MNQIKGQSLFLCDLVFYKIFLFTKIKGQEQNKVADVESYYAMDILFLDN